MERHAAAPREGWQAIVEAQGLIWHSEGDQSYWDESAYYSFASAEIETIETATEAVYELFLEAGEKIANDPNLMECSESRVSVTAPSRPPGAGAAFATTAASTSAITATA